MYVVLTMFAYFVLENNSTDQENDFLAVLFGFTAAILEQKCILLYCEG